MSPVRIRGDSRADGHIVADDRRQGRRQLVVRNDVAAQSGITLHHPENRGFVLEIFALAVAVELVQLAADVSLVNLDMAG